MDEEIENAILQALVDANDAGLDWLDQNYFALQAAKRLKPDLDTAATLTEVRALRIMMMMMESE